MGRIFLAILIPALLAGPAAARPLSIFTDEDEAEDMELKSAKRELAELERRIKNKDIPPIEFEFNKAVLLPQSQRALEMVADLLFKYPNLKLMVQGHTCDIGDDEYNMWLSQKRAEAVKDFLVEVGVMGETIKAKGFGETKPLFENDSEDNREKNRRVEFILVRRWWNSIF